MTDREALLIVYGWLIGKSETAYAHADAKIMTEQIKKQLFPLEDLISQLEPKKENE